MTKKPAMTRILTEADLEAIWSDLAGPDPTGDDEGVYRRIDPEHPLDIYAGIRRGLQAILLLITPIRPPEFRKLRSLSIETRRRGDSLYVLQLALQELALRPVFARLCADLVNATRSVDPQRGPAAILARLDRWWRLLEGQQTGLSCSVLIGLIAELLVLRDRLIPEFGADVAVKAWSGPDGGDQDFRLPTGLRIEVKAAWADEGAVKINGLDQLDGQGDPLDLLVVRLAETARSAPDGITAPALIAELRQNLGQYPLALSEFESLLAALHWHEHLTHHDLIVRFLGVEYHEVGESFPRLTRANVPFAVTDADYSLNLPPADLAPMTSGVTAKTSGGGHDRGRIPRGANRRG